MPATSLWILKGVKWLAIFYGACLLLYFPYAWCEWRQIDGFCSEIKPGMEMAALPPLAERYGFNRR